MERVADLHRWQILRALCGDVLRGKRRALDAVLSGGRPHDVHGIADAGSGGTDDFIGFKDAHGHCVHQRIYLVTRVEKDLAANDGHTEAVAVIADALHNALEQPFGAGVLEVPEPQAVELGNGARAHGEDVAVDPAHAGRRTLVGFQCGGVVVGFNFEGTAQAVADVHDPGVFLSRLDEHVGAFLGQRLEVLDGILVRTVLAPHDGVDAHLREIRRAAEDFFDFFEFICRQTHVLGLFQRGRCCRGVHCAGFCEQNYAARWT